MEKQNKLNRKAWIASSHWHSVIVASIYRIRWQEHDSHSTNAEPYDVICMSLGKRFEQRQWSVDPIFRKWLFVLFFVGGMYASFQNKVFKLTIAYLDRAAYWRKEWSAESAGQSLFLHSLCLMLPFHFLSDYLSDCLSKYFDWFLVSWRFTIYIQYHSKMYYLKCW